MIRYLYNNYKLSTFNCIIFKSLVCLLSFMNIMVFNAALKQNMF